MKTRVAADFTVASQLRDMDGSERLVLTIHDVPVGATLSDGRDTLYSHNGQHEC